MKPVFSFIQFSGIRTICADCNRLDYIRSSLKDINRLIFNMNPARRITTNNCVDIHLTRSVCKAANEKEVFKYHHHQCTHLLVVYSIRFLFYFIIFFVLLRPRCRIDFNSTGYSWHDRGDTEWEKKIDLCDAYGDFKFMRLYLIPISISISASP